MSIKLILIKAHGWILIALELIKEKLTYYSCINESCNLWNMQHNDAFLVYNLQTTNASFLKYAVKKWLFCQFSSNFRSTFPSISIHNAIACLYIVHSIVLANFQRLEKMIQQQLTRESLNIKLGEEHGIYKETVSS